MYKRLLLSVMVLVTSFCSPLFGRAASSTLLISELQTGTTASASQEFIELQNISAGDIELAGWRLEYKSATSAGTASAWVKHADLSGSLAAGAYYLVSTKAYLPGADAVWSDGLASTGGHVRLLDNHGVIVDLVGYGNANSAETSAATAPAAGKSISRILDATGLGIDSDNNSQDFGPASAPSPKNAVTNTQPSGSTPSPTAGSTPLPTSGAIATQTVDFSAISINELFIDPASPKSDDKDEFIELYNQSDVAVNLTGLKLQCGSNFHDSYTLPSTTIPAGGYLAFYSAVTKLALTNSGGAARLVSSGGLVLDQSAHYATAPAGQSWSSFDDGWHWTLSPTPNALNVLNIAVASAKTSAPGTASKISSSKTATSSSSRISPSRVAAASKALKTTAAKTFKSASAASSALADNPVAVNNGRWLLTGLIGLTIGYGIYEYRHHIYNLIEISKRYLRARRSAS